MRLLISIFIVGQLMSCIRHPPGADYAERAPYNPRPSVEVSMFTAEGRVVSAYVRHSSGDALLHLSPEHLRRSHDLTASELKLAVDLSSAKAIQFTPNRYENFERSFDVFQDGRIVFVPLSEESGAAAGVFVNLVSGKRYFLAPPVKSRESLVKISALANKWPEVTVILPEDRRAADRVARFPQFQR